MEQSTSPILNKASLTASKVSNQWLKLVNIHIENNLEIKVLEGILIFTSKSHQKNTEFVLWWSSWDKYRKFDENRKNSNRSASLETKKNI